MPDGPADLTVSDLLIIAATLDAHGTAPGVRTVLDKVQRAIDTHPDRKTGDDHE